MSILMRTRYVVVFPDQLEMDLEYGPDVREGDLLSSEQLGITSEPSGKWLIRRIAEEDPGEYPHIRYFFVEKL